MIRWLSDASRFFRVALVATTPLCLHFHRSIDFDSSAAALSGTPTLHTHERPVYILAPVIDTTANPMQAEQETTDLFNKLHQKLGRVAPSNGKPFLSINSCDKYPCEIVVEEVRVLDSHENQETHQKSVRYSYELDLRIVRQPGDNSPDDAKHENQTKPWFCRTNVDQTAEDCESGALYEMAAKLAKHDEDYHPGDRP